MTEPIPPALAPEEWVHGYRNTWRARVDESPHPHPGDHSHGRRLIVNTGAVVSDEKRLDRSECAALIALANAALPDSDPRKVTRAMVDYLRELADDLQGYDTESLNGIADALASYLPPEP